MDIFPALANKVIAADVDPAVCDVVAIREKILFDLDFVELAGVIDGVNGGVGCTMNRRYPCIERVLSWR